MKLTITGYSTALYSTWFLIEELGVLFDAGDGVSAGLLGKTGKIRHVFISHADRDHLTGLVQLNQLIARPGRPEIYYPKDCFSFPALKDFTARFDPHVSGATWTPIEDGFSVQIGTNRQVLAIRNGHVQPAADRAKSLSYKIIETKRKLKQEFIGLPGSEIGRLNAEKGPDFTTNEIQSTLLAYSGDTPVEDYDRYDNTQTLIHEATFFRSAGDMKTSGEKNLHSELESVLAMASEIKLERLILSHFSSRYGASEIDDMIRKGCIDYNIKIPVYRLLPGQIHRDILNQDPVNA